MSMASSSNALGVDHVVSLVGSNETDVDNAIRVVNPHHDPVFVARNIEHHTAVLEDTRAADGPFNVRRRRPVDSGSGAAFSLSEQGDLVYVSNAPGAEVQKFLQIIGPAVSPVASTAAVVYTDP
jgi:hypothetical protein